MKKLIKKHPLILIAVIYLILPWDLLPDFLGLLGFSDDLVITLLVLLRKYIQNKKGQKAEKPRDDKVN
jgi:uncharacterized membrane protein YkvA (DUF1232 family)